MPFPGQPREPEEIKFPLHSRSGWKKKTCIDSGSLDSSCSAAKDVGEMAELLWADAFPFLPRRNPRVALKDKMVGTCGCCNVLIFFPRVPHGCATCLPMQPTSLNLYHCVDLPASKRLQLLGNCNKLSYHERNY